MQNSKKLILALGLIVSIAGGVCNKAWAMEQSSMSPEMVELHKVISQKLFKANTPDSLLSVLREYDYRELIIDHTIDTPEHVYYLISYVYKPNFLQESSIAKLCSLKALIKTLNNIMTAIQEKESAVPGTINPLYQEGYNLIMYILPKLQQLFGLIQNASGITDEELNKIRKGCYEY